MSESNSPPGVKRHKLADRLINHTGGTRLEMNDYVLASDHDRVVTELDIAQEQVAKLESESKDDWTRITQLLEQLETARLVIDLILKQEQTKGYPTGSEWVDIIDAIKRGEGKP